MQVDVGFSLCHSECTLPDADIVIHRHGITVTDMDSFLAVMDSIICEFIAEFALWRDGQRCLG